VGWGTREDDEEEEERGLLLDLLPSTSALEAMDTLEGDTQGTYTFVQKEKKLKKKCSDT
jgi:hypothetical protein